MFKLPKLKFKLPPRRYVVRKAYCGDPGHGALYINGSRLAVEGIRNIAAYRWRWLAALRVKRMQGYGIKDILRYYYVKLPESLIADKYGSVQRVPEAAVVK